MIRTLPSSGAPGAHVGPYEIVGWLGAGGMGDVYRAHDPRLGREVAIKIIRETFVLDELRLHRFEQEARAAGQLNHPNILAVFDVGIHDGAPYIVSELLEGQSLRSRLDGGALTVRRAIDYACQAAAGLAAAHDKGVVHRDLKPDNLFITSDGRVKILDFGVAKLIGPPDGPTRTSYSRPETELGMVVGTTGYMSPEQVRGETVDARSDIFSFGAILYEMLTARPAFTRGTAAETVAAILKDDPPEPLPPVLDRIVSRCLEKAREARFQSMRDLAFGLDFPTPPTAIAEPAEARADGPAVRTLAVLPWTVAAAVTFGLALVLIRWPPWREVPPPAPLRLTAELGVDASLPFTNVVDATVLSPNGEVFAFVAEKQTSDLRYGRFPGVEPTRQLYVRRLDQLDARPLADTDGALTPFFSPDGMWIGFFSGGKLKKVAVTGGAVVTLADAPSGRGGSWSRDNTIVFAPNQTRGTRLLRVSAAGGHAEPLTSLDEHEVVQLWPQVLPGGKAVLYTSGSTAGAYNDADLVVQPLPGWGVRRIVQRAGYHGRYVPSGHLIYMHNGMLLAVPFDIDRMEVEGEAVPLLEGVASNSITGSAQFAVSASGRFVYQLGPSIGAGTALQWMDRAGTSTPLRLSPANWFALAFAPDGRRLALEIRERTSDVWIYQFAQDSLTRMTSDPFGATSPVWTPDSNRIAFASARADGVTPNLYWQRFPAMDGLQRLTESRNTQQPGSWHPSGRFLAFQETSPQTGADLMILPLGGDEASGWKPGKPTVFLRSPFREVEPAFSPDGRWLAYSSNESGREEVYVRPFPGPGPKWQISSGGGNLPTWSRTKPELFYGLSGQIMVAAFSVEGDSLRPQKPRLWAEERVQTRGDNRLFDLHPDGERFAVVPAQLLRREKQDKVVFVSRFFEELRRIAPPSRR